ncbi:MAG TPA: ribbon-helix-helix domain-containing protein [Arenicellales bacterium]|nr:ribbon-helix-helix domain-containing protein [Arenicellales bacterium]
MSARNISLRMRDDKIERIDRLAAELGRSRAWVLNQAADRYLEYEEWFAHQVRVGIAEDRAGDTVPHDEVMAGLRRRIGDAE